jgi:hypothetical protein
MEHTWTRFKVAPEENLFSILRITQMLYIERKKTSQRHSENEVTNEIVMFGGKYGRSCWNN